MKLARLEYQGEVFEATVACNGYALADGTILPTDEVRLLPAMAGG